MDCFRKIGVGENLKDAMYYVVGGRVYKGYIVSDIVLKKKEFIIYIKKGDIIQEWKSLNKSIVTYKERFLNEES